MSRSTHDCVLPDADWLAVFRRRLKSWYRKNARDLPWRRTRDPYSIWVSEIMLQQTQVATVIPYHQRFIAAFPAIHDLAAADEEHVLRLWEGLGYYRRARQLHRAAKVVVDRYGGLFPADLEQVLQLPGIGRYTAGAILSIAYDSRQPVLEANTIRLYSRLLAYEGDPTKSAGKKSLWAFAEHILPRKDVGQMNQAVMELGSKVCAPRNPSCAQCPVAPICAARLSGKENVIPIPTRPTKFTDVNEAALIIRNRGRILLRRCEEQERWAGLWDFPRFPVTKSSVRLQAKGAKRTRELLAGASDLVGLPIELGEHIETFKHGVTRYRITLDCYEAKLAVSSKRRKPFGETKWVAVNQLEDIPLSATGRKISQLLVNRG